MTKEQYVIKKKIRADIKYILRKAKDPFIGPHVVEQLDKTFIEKIRMILKSDDLKAIEMFYKNEVQPIRKIAKDGGSQMDFLKASAAQFKRIFPSA